MMLENSCQSAYADLSVLEDVVEQAGILQRHEGKVCMRALLSGLQRTSHGRLRR